MNLKLSTKLLISFLAVGVIPFLVIGLFSLTRSSKALTKQAFNQLEAVREIKKFQIESYFEERQGDMGVLMETVATLRQTAFENLSSVRVSRRKQLEQFFVERLGDMEVLSRNPLVTDYYTALNSIAKREGRGPAIDLTSSSYQKATGEYGSGLSHYCKTYGYYDVFLIDALSGEVWFSVSKEADYGTNLKTGEYRNSNLAELLRKVTDKRSPQLVDMAPYAPSDNAPAMFAGAPVYNDNHEITAVVASQISLDAIHAIMKNRAGMGETGECYLVGPDYLLRSDTYLDPDNRNVEASLNGTVSRNGVQTESVKKALNGESGEAVIRDYNGNPVLSSYAPVELGDFHWALLSEIDVAEAFCPKDESGKYFFTKYKEMYGYYDLFLINPDGYCFFTVEQESDYQTNLVDGKYSSSNLGKLVREVLDSGNFGLADFEPYAPSAGAPAAFIAQPVMSQGKPQIVVALQLSLEAINNVMTENAGMGKTGETYLVGPDKLMRSDSRLDPVNHTVAASFANPSLGKVDTEASRKALAGRSGSEIILDYNGSRVLSAYTALDVHGLTWALLAEIDETEAFAAVNAIKGWMTILGVVGVVVIICMAWLITRSITNPINEVVNGLNEGSEQLASAANQVSGASQQLAEGASEQAASLEETSSSLEEMSTMTRQTSSNTEQANASMREAQVTIGKANESMSELTESMRNILDASEETSKIVKTIDEIAFQTNLLALNAAVEAARAGEAGAGFSVVADEVRSLAMRAAEASRNTSELIERTLQQVRRGAGLVDTTDKAFSSVAQTASTVYNLLNEITSAAKEQSQGIGQINTAVAEMDKAVQSSAANSEESAAAAEELNAQAEQMKGFVQTLSNLVDGSNGNNGADEFGYGSMAAGNDRGSHKVLASSQRKKLQLNKSGDKSSGKKKSLPAGDEKWD